MAMTMTLASSQTTMTEQVSDKPRQAPDEGHWREIIGQIGTEVGLPLSAALERVTADDLLRLAQKYVDPDGSCITIVGDRAAIEPSLRAIGLPAPELRDADGERLPG